MKINCSLGQKNLIINCYQEISNKTLKYLKNFHINTTSPFSREEKISSLSVQSIYTSFPSNDPNHYTLLHGPILPSPKTSWDFASLSLCFENISIIAYPGNGQTKIQPTTQEFLSLKIAETAKKILQEEEGLQTPVFVGSSPINIRDFLRKTASRSASHLIELSLPLKTLREIAPQINQGLLTEKTIAKLLEKEMIYPENGPSIEEIVEQFHQEMKPIDLVKNIFYFQKNEKELALLIELLKEAKIENSRT